MSCVCILQIFIQSYMWVFLIKAAFTVDSLMGLEVRMENV